VLLLTSITFSLEEEIVKWKITHNDLLKIIPEGEMKEGRN